MCAGAIVQARIPRVVYGASNPKAGCAGSVLNLLSEPRYNHQAAVEAGLLGETCADLMRDFFRILRFFFLNLGDKKRAAQTESAEGSEKTE